MDTNTISMHWATLPGDPHTHKPIHIITQQPVAIFHMNTDEFYTNTTH